MNKVKLLYTFRGREFVNEPVWHGKSSAEI
jgi:hypothetical protein